MSTWNVYYLSYGAIRKTKIVSDLYSLANELSNAGITLDNVIKLEKVYNSEEDY